MKNLPPLQPFYSIGELAEMLDLSIYQTKRILQSLNIRCDSLVWIADLQPHCQSILNQATNKRNLGIQ